MHAKSAGNPADLGFDGVLNPQTPETRTSGPGIPSLSERGRFVGGPCNQPQPALKVRDGGITTTVAVPVFSNKA